MKDLADDAYPYSEYNGDHGGNVTKEEWQEQKEEARSLNAERNYELAVQEYEEKVLPGEARKRKLLLEEEQQRLKKLSYDIEKMEDALQGRCTKGQLLDFDINPEFGYLIEWKY
ncbi:hypothetical protein LJC56_08180 [Christensenellaceae bacterium OttesenSCG-928-K19]|nr:hypothetical protein [Christensenellaceae bacterium OttesenSCG-928-K19]